MQQETHSICTTRVWLVNRDVKQQTSWWRMTNHTLDNWTNTKQRQHPGLVARNRGNQRSTTFNQCLNLVSKSRLGLAQLHNYRPNIVDRPTGQTQLESDWGYRTGQKCTSINMQQMTNKHHLSLFGHLFDVSNDLLLLLFHVLPLTVKVTHCLVQCSLVLPQHLLRCFPATEKERHDEFC